MINYRQCCLEKRQGKSLLKQVAFIPEKYARLNSSIRIKHDGGDWENDWIVRSVGSQCRDSELPDSHRGIKEHKKRTGDTLPKPGIHVSGKSKQ